MTMLENKSDKTFLTSVKSAILNLKIHDFFWHNIIIQKEEMSLMLIDIAVKQCVTPLC